MRRKIVMAAAMMVGLSSMLSAELSAVCAKGQNYHFGSNGVKKDIVKAVEIYEVGCKNGDHGSCFQLGVIYADGNGVIKKDARKAIKYLSPGCDEGEGDADVCDYLGTAYEEVGDRANALKATDKACALSKNMIVCDRAYMLENPPPGNR